MKETFLIVGIIAAGIMVIVLLLNQSPDLLSYDFKNENEYNEVTKQVFPELKFSIVTSKPSFWDQVAGLNQSKTTVSSSDKAVSSTDENGNEIPQVTDKNGNIDDTTENNNPVTTVPK